ncbi:uncharacterized protein BDZ99DRAFT_399651 [Mytilinidion resinicola]|uniref:Uncharacterized protein n=1 Tax=Mytilinidion resinicola TaxID=574789 RepID=A0A6A6Y538_9PEZI|nr:uncharacterized protein BDZ99DRAFT_399651 [Mytilinidion resinicola]KAF2803633.1 hypothetical protein BDZ99DRAFT_399651 [Mytilinidion resinicola]
MGTPGFADDGDDDGGYNDFGTYHYDSNGFQDIEGKTKTLHLNLKTTYQPSWGGREAFREFYQNWSTEFKESKTTIEIRAVNKGVLMGYILYKWDKYQTGTLELVNFNASLRKDHLALGATAKKDDDTQSGQFGEGLKLAILVFLRNPQNNAVRMKTSSVTLNFKLDQEGNLVCTVTKHDKEKVRVNMAKERDRIAKKERRQFKANTWEDVSLEIGFSRSVKTETGERQKTPKISLQDFKDWLTITLDINPPTDIIQTFAGDLILDPAYKGKTYLKGLLLPNGSASGKPFQFGYNFLDGETDRDRGRVTDPSDEARAIAGIWGAASNAIPDSSSINRVTVEYTNLLMTKFTEPTISANVHSAAEHIWRSTAVKVWKYMLSQHSHEESQSHPFYYCPGKEPEGAKVIRECIKREPVPLDRTLWGVFRKFGLCRTSHEERRKRFQEAEQSVLPSTCFAQHIVRSLEACLASDPATAGKIIIFVQAHDTGVDVIYSNLDTTWKVSDKWLNYAGAHEHAPCVLSPADSEFQTNGGLSEVFWCDHAISSLYRVMIDQLLGADIVGGRFRELRMRLESIATIQISQMAKGVQVAPTSQPGELKVTWKSAEQADIYSAESPQETLVILHRKDTCAEKATLKLFEEDASKCQCLSLSVPHSCRKALFNGLEETLEYFPMICRAEQGAFFAVPPPAVRPIARMKNSIPLLSSLALVVDDDAFLGSYSDSDTDDTELDIPSPVGSSLESSMVVGGTPRKIPALKAPPTSLVANEESAVSPNTTWSKCTIHEQTHL